MESSANGTDEATSLEKITCIDHVNHNAVKYGELFFSEKCVMCKCGFPEWNCRRIWCPPASSCNGVVTKDPRHCCDICTPSVILGGSGEHVGGPSLKLGGMTVTFLILVSTVFFVLHRLRKKRLLITVRRCRSFDGLDLDRYRNYSNTQCSQCPVSEAPISRERFSDLLPNVYADPPPSYFVATNAPTRNNRPMNAPVYTLPPPPYFLANPRCRSSSSLSDSNGSSPKCRRVQRCHSWPNFIDDKENWATSLFRNCADRTAQINSTVVSRNYGSTNALNEQTYSSSCSSSSCYSSGCDCHSYTTYDPTTVHVISSSGIVRPPVERRSSAVD